MASAQVTGYSFYLNVVVVNNPTAKSSHGSPPQLLNEMAEKEVPPPAQASSPTMGPPALTLPDATKALTAMKNSLARSADNVSKRTAAFVASKTVISRASTAIDESIPHISEALGLDLKVMRRFSQGPVFVLEVDVKACDMALLIEKTSGNEAAFRYKTVKSGMEFLGTTEAKKAFDAEMLPSVRRGLMAKLGEILPSLMIQDVKNSDLEVECIALEDAEEARWLYNFLAFAQQMK